MTKEEVATEIVEGLDLGDHPWDDAYTITLGKLKDRSTYVYNTIGMDRVKTQIAYVMKNFLSAARTATIVETANYYKEKYKLDEPS